MTPHLRVHSSNATPFEPRTFNNSFGCKACGELEATAVTLPCFLLVGTIGDASQFVLRCISYKGLGFHKIAGVGTPIIPLSDLQIPRVESVSGRPNRTVRLAHFPDLDCGTQRPKREGEAPLGLPVERVRARKSALRLFQGRPRITPWKTIHPGPLKHLRTGW